MVVKINYSKKELLAQANEKKREEESLAKMRAEIQEARAKASKKIVIDDDVPDRFVMIKKLIEMKQGNLIDEKMVTGLNRADLLKYLKKGKVNIPAILTQTTSASAPAPNPTPAPTPKVDALPAEKPKAKGKPGPKPKTQKDPDAPKPPRKKRETTWVDPDKKRVTDFQVINPIWKHLVMLKIAKTKDDADAIDTLQGTIDAYKISRPYKHINPASIKKIFDAKKVDIPIPDWLQNYGFVPPQSKKPRGRPAKAKPEPVVDQTMKTDLSNAQLKTKLLQKSKDKLKLENDKLKLENDEKDARLLEAQRFINELENTLRDYSIELDKCRKQNGPYVSKKLERPAMLLAGMDESAYEPPAPIVVPTRTPKKTKKVAKPPQQFRLTNVMTEQQYLDKQIAKNESGMMGAEDINVAKEESSKLFSFFHNLQVKGREYEATGIQYMSNGLMIAILTYYLNNKYGLSSSVSRTPITFNLDGPNDKEIGKLKRKLKECVPQLRSGQNIMFIPIGMKINTQGSHTNMLIFRRDGFVVEHYDPKGSDSPQFKKLVNILRPVFDDMRINYEPSQIPVGFQKIESTMKRTLGPDIIAREGSVGFCTMWSFLVAEMALANPAMSTDDILQYLLSKITKTNQNLFLRNIIRGYTHYLYESLSAFLKEKYNIDLDLTQKIEESKMRDIILELEKVYNEPKTQAKETIPVPAPVAPPKPPPAKYQNIIEEWDMGTLPYILQQQEPKIYDAIEKKINSLEKKGDGVVIADLLVFIKPFVDNLFAHYGSNMNALTIIQDGMEVLIKYINSDVVRHRDDTPYLGKFFKQKNKMIIYNLLKNEQKTQAKERETMGAEDVNILKFPDPTVICDDNNYCIAFGKSAKVLKLFDDLNFNYVSQMKTLSDGSNGFLLTINYEKQPYKLSTILKSSSDDRSSNLAYEYIVGQMINRYNKIYPCFIETYHLFKYKTKKDYETIKKKYNKRGTNAIFDTEYLQTGLDLVNTKFDLTNIDSTCIDSLLFCTQIQYLENSRTLKDSISDQDFVRNELTNVLYQIYTPLSYMHQEFTHYDLHFENVLVLKPYADMYFEYNYHYSPTNIVTFNSQYIAKIIDYGNAHFNNMDGFNTSSLVQVLKQKTTQLKLIKSGYSNIAYSTQITPQESNFSADLRLLYIIKRAYKSGPLVSLLKDVVFKGPYSTPRNDTTDGKINNILQAKDRLEAGIKEENFLHTIKNNGLETRFTKVGTIHVYMDNKTQMKYVSAI